MKLIIVESPKKAKTIEKYLGQEYRVRASGGHICDLPQKSLGIDVNNNFKPEYVISADKQKTIDMLKNEIKKSECVYLATDPDREGEAISWHLQTELGLPAEGENRIEFHEISKKAVSAAIKTPRKVNMNLVNAQQARRVLDRLVGYKVSPIISKKIKSGLSAGRVQSAALRMLVDREREIRNFVPEEYWTLHGFFYKDTDNFKAIYEDKNRKKHKIKSKQELDTILSAISNSQFKVTDVSKAVKKENPKPPFTTSTLQQDATSKFSMTAPDVMKVAQQLYEGVEIEGEGQVALVTYIRTDSVRVSDDALKAVRELIGDKYGDKYLPKNPIYYKQQNQAQDAHEAIRPISLERTPESLRKKLTRNVYLIYKLIYDRFVASQMSPALYNTLDVRIGVIGTDGNDYGFHMKGRALKFAGFTAVYSEANSASDEDGDISSPLEEGDEVMLKEFKYEQKFTKPPQRYTESSLIKAMEDNGIGRPSTYASIISVLAKREYFEKDGKYMAATSLGEVVIDEIKKNFADIIDLKFTANMEKELDNIGDGLREWQALISDFYPGFMLHVRQAMADGGSVKLPPEVSDVKCDKCGAFMVIKEGKNGKFLACPNYPRCKNTQSIGKTVICKCPKCKTRNVIQRTSKKGKVFYGCEGYPTCDFASWDIPAPYFCPECGSTMKVITRKGEKFYKCIQCAHQETEKKE